MKILKFIGKAVIVLLLLMILFWTAVFGALQTSSGQTWAFNTMVRYLEEKTQTEIHIGKFAFTFPFHLKIYNLTVSKHGEPVAAIEEAEAACAFQHLPEGRLIFSSVNVSEISLFQLPKSDSIPENINSSEITLWDKPILPFYLKIEKLNIQRLHLAPEVIDQFALPPEITQLAKHSTFSLQGTICNHPFKNAISAHLLAAIQDEHSESSLLSVAIDAQNHQLSFSLHANTLPIHLFAQSYPSSAINTRLAFYAAAPLISWQKIVNHQTDKDDLPIEGHFKLTAEADSNHPLYAALIGPRSAIKGHFIYQTSNTIEFPELLLKIPNMKLKGFAQISAEGEIHHSTFKGKLARLDQLKDWFGRTIEGKLQFEGHATGPIRSPTFDINLKSPSLTIFDKVFENIRTSIQATLLKESFTGHLFFGFNHQEVPCQLEATVNWEKQTCISLSHIRLDTLGIQLQGDLSCSNPDYIWEGKIEAQANHLEEISQFLKTPLAGKAQITAHLAAMKEVNKHPQQRVRLEFLGDAIQWSDGEANRINIHAETSSLNTEGELFALQARLEGEKIKWQKNSMASLAINGTSTVDLSERSLFDLTSEWSAQDIRWKSGQAKEGRGKIHLTNPLALDKGSLEATINGFQTETMQLDEITGTTRFDQTEAQWPYKIYALGVWKEQLHLNAEGSWHYQKDRIELAADRLTGQLGSYPVELMQPSRFQSTPEGIQLTGLHLRLAEAEFQGEFKQEHQSVFSRFKSNAIPSELFHFIAPDLPLAGRATIQGQLEGTMEQPKGTLQIGLHHIQITEDIFAQNPFMEGTIDLQLNHQGIQLQSTLHGIGQTPIAISGHLPADIRLHPLTFKLERERPFDLAVDAEGELGPYLHLFYTEAIHLAGQAKIGLKFSGKINAPEVYGSIDISKGSFESLNTGAIYNNIQVHLEGDGSKIALTHFNAEDAKHGTIAATGAITLDAKQNFPYEFQIRPTQIFIIDSDFASMSASGPLTLSGNRNQSKLQGTLTIDQATIQLEETDSRRLKTVEVKYFNLPDGDELPAYFDKNETRWVVDLDVTLQIPHTLAIKGKKIDSEWKGSVAIKGTPDHPQLFGDLQIASGSYDFNGKIFNLSQGNIHFGGDLEKKTTLYVVASKEIDPINAEIIVKGLANKPEISFRSNPPLSQREVLSYILFNRGISDITTDQGDQLSQSFIALNKSDQSTTEGNDFLSRVRNKIGIDRLDFGAANSENKDFAMQVGKRITENIYVSINQYMNAAAPLFAVEVKLHKNIKAQADAGRIGDDNQFRTSIKWKKNY